MLDSQDSSVVICVWFLEPMVQEERTDPFKLSLTSIPHTSRQTHKDLYTMLNYVNVYASVCTSAVLAETRKLCHIP
jgi:hypothetical protein